ncbi:MAG: coniferyl aldehyde dehydrogenase, partial [Pseudomonadota bacterium]
MADDRKSEMEAVLRKQRAAHNQMRPEPMALRKDRIQRAMKLLTDHAEDLCKVMAADFGNRSPHQSMITDIAGTVNFGKYCLKHMDKWSRAEKRHVQFPLGL